jgi:heat shock protein HslJ
MSATAKQQAGQLTLRPVKLTSATKQDQASSQLSRSNITASSGQPAHFGRSLGTCRIRRTVALALVFWASLAACGGGGTVTEDLPGVRQIGKLPGRWQLTTLLVDGTDHFATAPPKIVMTLSRTMLRGTSACNSFASGFTAGPDYSFTINGLGTTNSPCPYPNGPHELALFDALKRVHTWSINDVGNLTLIGENVVLAFEPATQPTPAHTATIPVLALRPLNLP